jgi:hypothetical protein
MGQRPLGLEVLPQVARRVTLFPEPDSPRSANTLPASSEKVTSFTARTNP